MLLLLEIVGLLCMITIMFVAIWGFILMNQMVGQLRYKNYLLEKISQHLYMLSKEDEETK